MQMTHVIINFRRHLKRRNYSPHTVKYYLNIIKQYVIWVDVALELATPEKVDMYIDHLLRKRMNPASINLYLVIIRVFYDYLRYEERVDLTNPVKRNRRLRVPRPLPRSLRDQEVEKLFGVIKNKRDVAMFKLMLRCGLRVEEVSNLSLGDMDLKKRRIIVQQGKGGKGRVVYISDDAHDALVAYLKIRSHYRIKKVFLVEKGTYKGQPISVRGIQKRIYSFFSAIFGQISFVESCSFQNSRKLVPG
jgi:site-specific recombinase XerD